MYINVLKKTNYTYIIENYKKKKTEVNIIFIIL